VKAICYAIILLLLYSGAYSAEISLAYSIEHPDNFIGIKIEGNIVEGDADALLNFLSDFGPPDVPIYLASKGGNVMEAIKLGRIMRRLRLTSLVPVSMPGQPNGCIKLSDPSNCVCASACFLVHAGAANRYGNLIALHRPFVSPEATKNMSSTQQEAAQKSAMATVRNYLEEMEVPAYYTDLMMSRNSQDAYMVSFREASDDKHRIEGYVPSIEEITLSRCKVMPKSEREKAESRIGKAASPEEKAELKKYYDELQNGYRCQADVLRSMKEEAFASEFPDPYMWWKKKL